MEVMAWVPVAHLVATLMMAGLIWFVQVVHYPLFAAVGDGALRDYAQEHARRTTVVVMPLMVVELLGAVWLAFARPGAAAWTGLALLAVIWTSTAFLQVPLHQSLAVAGSRREVARLVRGNWIRTMGWTLRVPVAVYLLLA